MNMIITFRAVDGEYIIKVSRGIIKHHKHVSYKIPINDTGGARRSKQPIQRIQGQTLRSPLIFFRCKNTDIVFPQCLHIVWIQQKSLRDISSGGIKLKCFRLSTRVYKM